MHHIDGNVHSAPWSCSLPLIWLCTLHLKAKTVAEDPADCCVINYNGDTPSPVQSRTCHYSYEGLATAWQLHAIK